MFVKLTIRLLISVGLCALVACSSHQQPGVGTKTAVTPAQLPTVNLSDQAYAEQLAQVAAHPDAVAYAKLRQLFVKTTRYPSHLHLENALTGSIFQAMDQQDWQGCYDKSSTLLKSSMISLNGHFAAMVCAEKMNNVSKAAWHKQQLDLLVEAIWQSGDGKSAKTAFFCTGTAELYAFVRLHGLKVTQQALVSEQQKQLDVMQLQQENSQQTVTWYFDVTSQMAVEFTAGANSHDSH